MLWKSLSHVWLFATPGLQSMGFSRPEYWSAQPYPSPGDLPNPGIEARSPTLQAESLSAEPPGKPKNTGVGSLSLLQGSSWPRNWTGVSCPVGRFFTNWAIREAHIHVIRDNFNFPTLSLCATETKFSACLAYSPLKKNKPSDLVVTSSSVLILVTSMHSQMQALGAADPPSCPISQLNAYFQLWV